MCGIIHAFQERHHWLRIYMFRDSLNISDVTLSDLVEDLCAKSNEFAARNNFEYYKAFRHAHGKALIQEIISLPGQYE